MQSRLFLLKRKGRKRKLPVTSVVAGGLSVALLASEAVLEGALLGFCWVGGAGFF